MEDLIPRSDLFKSFWLAGFESACHINRAGQRLDMLAITQHDREVSQDYALLRNSGIQTARDGVRWHLIEQAGQYDFSSLAPMVEAANQHGIQVMWNICHYGWPNGLDVFAPAFVDRFAKFCRAVARFIREYTDAAPFYVPINEISFLSWAAGLVGYIYPYKRHQGVTLKQQLIRAVIAGCEAIWSVDRRARFAHVEPLIHVIAPRGRPELAKKAAQQRVSQFEAWDMLLGRDCPELGGHPRYLDIIGVNYYHSNQWEYPDQRLRWEDDPRDERWVPFHHLLAEVYERYHRPLFIAETSHFGTGRAPWIREIMDEVKQAIRSGTPVQGICLYPILDRPDWDDLNHWHNSGLWDLQADEQGRLRRVLNEAYAAELNFMQQAERHP
ncbi:MAG: beta-glucosidase [Anaerolineae bacterium]|nr:beta-glucosidase [Anaerolineae bacterium]